MQRTPSQISDFVKSVQYKMDEPAQYFGDEPNSYQKDWDATKVRGVICAAWAYEAAAGNQSVPSVYKAINLGEDNLCDRWYLPKTPRDLRLFITNGYPAFGIETKHQLSDFDVVMTSIAYPVLMISFIKYLEMSGIPCRSKDRHQSPGDHPFVLIGGQAYGAPGPLVPVADAIWCGEVEDEPGNPGILAVWERIGEFKDLGMWTADRLNCYSLLAQEFRFLYFPHLFNVAYEYEDRTHVGLEHLSLQVVSYQSTTPNMRVPVLKRFVKDMNAIPPLDNPPLLYTDPGMGAGDVEVGRGCPAWCNFCALTYRQKPYRQRDVDYMVEYGREVSKNLGSVNLVPFMPDFPMHTQRKKLVGTLLEKVTDEVEGGAMRVDDFIADPNYILLQVFGGMDGVTLGVEGNSQRMRDLVGKGTADADIHEAVRRGIQAGIRKFKFFMISNLPGEDEGDIFKIYKLASDLAKIRDEMGQPNVRLQFSWTPLLTEANTPFQWLAPPQFTRTLGDVWEEFDKLKIDFKLGGKAEINKSTYFQLCQRASPLVGEVIVDVSASIDNGCWGGVPKHVYQALCDGLVAKGFKNGISDAYDEREKHDMFGWEMIDQGINPELLWVTYRQMIEFIEETDSHTYDLNFDSDYHGNEWVERCDTKCYGKTCGNCDADDLKLRQKYIRAAQTEEVYDLHKVKVIDQKSLAMKVRIRIEKSLEKRYVQNSHWHFAIRRAAFTADVPITKRYVRLASDSIRYKDYTYGVDYLEIGLTKRQTRPQIQAHLDAMNEILDGIILTDFVLVPADSVSLRTDVDLSLFELETDDDTYSLQRWVNDFYNASYIEMTLRQDTGFFGATQEVVNLKDYCDQVWIAREGHRLVLKMMVRGKASPYDVYQALSGKKSQIESMKYAARRIDAFVDYDKDQQDFFRPSSVSSGEAIPVNPLDKPFSFEHTPYEQDLHLGKLVSA